MFLDSVFHADAETVSPMDRGGDVVAKPPVIFLDHADFFSCSQGCVFASMANEVR